LSGGPHLDRRPQRGDRTRRRDQRRGPDRGVRSRPTDLASKAIVERLDAADASASHLPGGSGSPHGRV